MSPLLFTSGRKLMVIGMESQKPSCLRKTSRLSPGSTPTRTQRALNVPHRIIAFVTQITRRTATLLTHQTQFTIAIVQPDNLHTHPTHAPSSHHVEKYRATPSIHNLRKLNSSGTHCNLLRNRDNRITHLRPSLTPSFVLSMYWLRADFWLYPPHL